MKSVLFIALALGMVASAQTSFASTSNATQSQVTCSQSNLFRSSGRSSGGIAGLEDPAPPADRVAQCAEECKPTSGGGEGGGPDGQTGCMKDCLARGGGNTP